MDDYSGIGSRFEAIFVDSLIIIIFAILFIRIAPEGLTQDALIFMIFIGYFTFLEGKGGQTLGKKMAKIKVVKEDGTPCDFRSALIRNILRFVDGLPTFYIIGIMSIAMSAKSQRLGDRAAKTIVISLGK